MSKMLKENWCWAISSVAFPGLQLASALVRDFIAGGTVSQRAVYVSQRVCFSDKRVAFKQCSSYATLANFAPASS